jgi:monoterpene epsilon-lactone hydrolase
MCQPWTVCRRGASGNGTAVFGKTSVRAALLIASMRPTGMKQTFADVDKLHESIDKEQSPENVTPPDSVAERLAVERLELLGHPVFTLRPRENPTARHVLYFHGGAYAHQIQEYPAMFHAWMIASIPEARQTTARIADLVARG